MVDILIAEPYTESTGGGQNELTGKCDQEYSADHAVQPWSGKQVLLSVYDPATGNYTIGTKVGDSYLNAPLLMSPEEYLSLMEEVEDAKLLRLAESRLQNFTPAETIPAEDVYQKYGISDADLADFDEVELE